MWAAIPNVLQLWLSTTKTDGPNMNPGPYWKKAWNLLCQYCLSLKSYCTFCFLAWAWEQCPGFFWVNYVQSRSKASSPEWWLARPSEQSLYWSSSFPWCKQSLDSMALISFFRWYASSWLFSRTYSFRKRGECIQHTKCDRQILRSLEFPLSHHSVCHNGLDVSKNVQKVRPPSKEVKGHRRWSKAVKKLYEHF